MPPATIIRVIDVHTDGNASKVVYAVEDREVPCLWEGAPPRPGSVYVIDTEHPGREARLLGVPAPGAWTAGNDALRWRTPVDPAIGVSRMEILRKRHVIRRALRDVLDAEGFLEIDTPLLVHGASPDIAIDSFKIDDRYLISSAEYQLKRLAVGGFSKIYSLTKNFRRGDQSRVRNPEFTMLEWGRVGGFMRQIENDTEAIVMRALDDLKIGRAVSYQGKVLDFTAPWKRMPVLEAIERTTGVSMAAFDAEGCRKAALASGLEVRTEWAENRDFLFSLLMDHVQPMLGREAPVFLTEWPMFQTTSAAADPDDPALASRSELYIGGIEIADGFAGLADPALQEYLFNGAQALRILAGKDAVELDRRYLEAMTLGAPYGAGMALGFDRLVMLLTDQSDIGAVLAFGWDEV